MSKKQVLLSMPEELHQRLDDFARSEMRSVSNAVMYLVEKGLQSPRPESKGMVPGEIEGMRLKDEFENMHPVSDPEWVCCKKRQPCRHWAFDGEVWKNALSGRVKEVE